MRTDRSVGVRTAMLLALVLLGLATAAAACGDSDGGTAAGGDPLGIRDLEGSINASGSSTVEPITARVGELFEDQASGVAVTVAGPGTGDGFKSFCEGETDISDASRAIKDLEIETCADNGIEYVELRVAFDGIAVLANPGNPLECVTFADLYALLGAESEGFDDWTDAEKFASELGSTTEFPDASLEIAAPGSESGTYDSFIEIVLDGIAEERLGEDAETSVRTDIPGQAEDNVIVQGIAGSEGSLGWVGFAYAAENADIVKALQVDDGESGCTAPTVDTIADGTYPVSRPLFIYVNKAKAESNPALAPFIDFYLDQAYIDAVTLAFGKSGYVALPEDLLTETKNVWAAR